MRFDDRVIIVTGAGRGLGRAYARYFASEGAAVVVNDLGTDLGGAGADSELANAVVEEIVAAGGKAVANGASVATTEGAESMVADALANFGRVDVVVNNAGILTFEDFPDVTLEKLMLHLSVHVGGAFNVTRAAWPHMAEQKYGRVVMTTSTAFFGVGPQMLYSTSKGAIVSLTRSLAHTGQDVGIKVNAIAPAGGTRMVDNPDIADRRKNVTWLQGELDPIREPERSVPMAAVLAHESCPVTGEILFGGFSHHARIFLAETSGYTDPNPTPEGLLENWDAIVSMDDYVAPENSWEHAAVIEERIAAYRERHAS